MIWQEAKCVWVMLLFLKDGMAMRFWRAIRHCDVLHAHENPCHRSARLLESYECYSCLLIGHDGDRTPDNLAMLYDKRKKPLKHGPAWRQDARSTPFSTCAAIRESGSTYGDMRSPMTSQIPPASSPGSVKYYQPWHGNMTDNREIPIIRVRAS
jgi:hypothetical protein